MRGNKKIVKNIRTYGTLLEMYRYQNFNRYRYRYRYLDFSVLKLFIYTAFYSKGDTSRTYEQAIPKQLIPNLTN